MWKSSCASAAALVLALSLVLPTSAARAAVLVVGPEEIRVSGTIGDADAVQLRQLLRDNPGVVRVVFDRCIGGTVGAAFEFATLIRAHRLATVASHQASSACAMAFLAGHERRFDDNAPFTTIVLHAGRRPDGSGPSSPVVNRRILLFLETATDGKLSPRLLRLVESSWSEAAGVMFLRRHDGGQRLHEVRHCDGTQGSDAGLCRTLPEFDPVSQGIVTAL
ncbi:hypothetical protein [Ramlibacter sp.]|uniref:hypothetical protein n=1 Tax=Ramlibacter sp. TaxID=1917967 RepID=UPI003D0B9A3A